MPKHIPAKAEKTQKAINVISELIIRISIISIGYYNLFYKKVKKIIYSDSSVGEVCSSHGNNKDDKMALRIQEQDAEQRKLALVQYT
jgi:hypothetical protein